MPIVENVVSVTLKFALVKKTLWPGKTGMSASAIAFVASSVSIAGFATRSFECDQR